MGRLKEMDEDAEVRLAHQPSWTFVYAHHVHQPREGVDQEEDTAYPQLLAGGDTGEAPASPEAVR